MMDILLVQHCPVPQIRAFLSAVFDCSTERVKIFSLDEFNSLSEELNDLSFDCVCVFSPVRGDVAQLLQLYRYKTSNSDAVKRIVDIALHNKVHCYVPSDSLSGWIYMGDGESPERAQQIECEEEDNFLFKLI
jgi:hypothetical protein